ncbi:MAG: hypothetical protein C5B54_08005 [Acidobacteria bacterium]|nr:MAG: hypothetical protein C5B54_08005 [Acidobacteriota bacterium]
MKDGDLRTLFRVKFRDWQWTSVETAGTASGVPDSEFCTPYGVQGWIEFKLTHINKVAIRPFQVAWLDRRCRYGGNAWIAVRRVPNSQRENGVDQLVLMSGNQAKALYEMGIEGTVRCEWNGGLGNWNWTEVSNILQGLQSI